MVELLRRRAREQAGQTLYTFLADGESEAGHLSFAELDRQAQAIARALEDFGTPGERALLVYPSGLEFIAAFFGCLYAGWVAVPAYPPRRRGNARLAAIVRDCQPAVTLTTAALAKQLDRLARREPELGARPCLATDGLEGVKEASSAGAAGAWEPFEADEATLAFLQYTSGSTGTPKGVRVSHGNLLHNEEMMRQAFGQSAESVVVGWLPLFHDMGLIGNVLQPLYLGARCVLMPPVSFLQKPSRWLAAIDRYRGTTSGGPDFAYTLCTERISEDELRRLDLSSWTVAFNGAEPVRAATLERFADTFAVCGFKHRAFFPCYGLAEATLFVSGGAADREPTVRDFDPSALENDMAVPRTDGRALVSSGHPWLGQEVVVVDPEVTETGGRRLEDGQVGEVWVRGPSVAGGYWEKPEVSRRDFAARLASQVLPEEGFLRTGDLGFLQDGELFLTGRLKELIILRGRNLYPHDLEAVAEGAHPALRAGASAAFSLDVDGEERLVLALEVERRALRALDTGAVVAAIRQAVAEAFEVNVHGVALLKPATLPKTSSGKIRRHACRDAWLEGTLASLSEDVLKGAGTVPEGAGWDGEEEADFHLDAAELRARPPEERRRRLRVHVGAWLARRWRIAADDLDPRRALTAQGLDSLLASELVGHLQSELGVAPDLADLLDGAELETLAFKLAAQLEADKLEPLPIDSGPELGEHPLSFGQAGMWFLHRLAPDAAAFHVAAAARLRGPLDRAAFEQALHLLVGRHAQLRAHFVGGVEPVLEVVAEAARGLDYQVDGPPQAGRGDSAGALSERLAEIAHQPFDLESGPLVRVRLVALADDEHALLLVVHHAVADFWSLAVLLEELGTLYHGLAEGGDAGILPEPPALRYTDWTRWQRRRIRSDEGERLAAYWQKTLGGVLEPLALLPDKPRPPVWTWRGTACRHRLSGESLARLEGLARDAEATLYAVLLAAWQGFLHRLTGQNEVLVGTPTAGRERAEIEGVVGYFVNPVVLRGLPGRVGGIEEVETKGRARFSRFLEQTWRSALGAFRHRDYPFDLLVERLQPTREPSSTPIFQTWLAFQQAPRHVSGWGAALDAFAVGAEGGRVALGGLEWEPLALPVRAAQVELSLEAAVVAGAGSRELALRLTLNHDLYDATTGDRLLAGFAAFLEAVGRDAEARLCELPLLDEVGRRQVLLEWNRTARQAPPACLHHLVEQRARSMPERVAVVGDDGTLTYGGLMRASERLAGELQRRGVGPEVVVAVAMERGVSMVTAILGILRAGGAWLPLDPSYPAERLRFMVEDAWSSSGPRVLVGETDFEWAVGVERLTAGTIRKAGSSPRSEAAPLGLPPEGEAPVVKSSVGVENLAYVIYTSGSTGRPKGVQVSHAAAVNFLRAMEEEPGLGAGDVLLAVTTLAFDISVLELFLPLLVGARLEIASRALVGDSQRLARCLEERGIHVLQATPSTWRLLLEGGWTGGAGLRMLSGGEALPTEVAAQLGQLDGGELWNMYGPTETTVWSAARRVASGEAPVRVGGTLANTRLHMLDRHLQPLPVGVVGDVWIAGAGLARGYLDRPSLTAERFVPDPFAAETESAIAMPAAGARLYDVGDMARFLADGTLELLGRRDHQVKIRGYRIELGEIEAALAEHPGVEQAVAGVREIAGDPRLGAWILGSVDPAELRPFLRQRVPEHMVPSVFVPIESLPLTPNGKIDRRALELPQATESQTSHAQSDLEQHVATLWCEALGIASVGPDDNFFDLGGHSLLVTRLHARLQPDHPTLEVVHLFQYPTVRSLANFLSRGLRARSGLAPVEIRSLEASEIAIVGMACRFPGAPDVSSFWNLLREGREAIRFLTDDDLEGVSPELLADPRYVRARGLLEDAAAFDAAFFGFTPREAEVMDPQHRLFLECAWEALEDAGYAAGERPLRAGLFAGVGMNSYLLHAGEELLASRLGSYQAFIANDKDFVPTRVSYKLDLRGPSVNVQTACSSSLVAVHLACQSLAAGEADMALAGGVTVRVPQKRGYLYEPGGILSKDGHCRAFDAQAGGTVLGNGLGVVVLKHLGTARADGDQILAVIKGSAINNDGGNKIGYTAPSIEGQTEVLTAALRAAKVDPATVGYIEAHGTGTELGDPIEVAALTQAFRAAGAAEPGGSSCALGSVKTNLGHLDTAAGIAGLIKAVLALQHGELPPSLHFEAPNPRIPFADGPFYVNSELRPWDSEGPRRAGVSSFGIGGTNAHVVLEEAPPRTEVAVEHVETEEHRSQLLLLSARSRAALDTMTERFAAHLRSERPELADVAYTLQVGRRAFEHRRWLVADDLDAAIAALDPLDPEQVRSGAVGGGAVGGGATRSADGLRGGGQVAFLFSGQGSQHLDMGRQLYAVEPVFRSWVDQGADHLREDLGFDLRQAIFPQHGDPETNATRLRDTRVAQPALFVVEYALAQVWMSWGLEPRALLGHSIGEWVAATLAGVFQLEDALRLVAERGRLMAEQPPGAMLGVGLGEAELGERLAMPGFHRDLAVATINGAADCVVAGPIEAVAELAARFEADGVRCRALHTSHAFHSSMMEPAVEPLVRAVAKVDRAAPRIPFVSNLTGTWITDTEATDPTYWGRQLRGAVRFSDGVMAVADRCEILLEVGPGRSLATLAQRVLSAPGATRRPAVSSLPHPRDPRSDERSMLDALGRLWQAGSEIDWQSIIQGRGERRQRVSLPPYPFEHRRFWLDPEPSAASGTAGEGPMEAGLAPSADRARWLYAPRWTEDLEPPSAASRAHDEIWILLVPTRELGEALLKPLAAHPIIAEHPITAERPITIAVPGSTFAEHTSLEIAEAAVFDVNPQSHEDWSKLLNAAADGAPERPMHVVDARALEPSASRGEDFLEGCLALVRTLAARDRPARLSVVTRGTWRVVGHDAISPEGAVLWGLLQAVPQELPKVACRAIDTDPLAEDRLLDELAEELLSTPKTWPEGAPVEVALRGGGRWRRDWAPLDLGDVDTEPFASLASGGGVCLVLGGLGGVGLALAQGIAERVPGARFVLVARRGLPPRETWGDPNLESEDRRRISGVRTLESLGAGVRAVAADVSAPGALTAVVTRLPAAWGPIRGVIHAAGVPGGGLLHTREPAETAAVLAPKVAGTRALAEALEGVAGLEFVVLCSSINSVVGGWGQADYCAANAYLDAWSCSRASQRRPRVVSLDWDRWRGVGMAASLTGGGAAHPLLGPRVAAEAQRQIYRAIYRVEERWVLSEHRIAGRPTVPGATYLEMARAAYTRRADGAGVEIRRTSFLEPLVVEEGGRREVLTVMEESGSGDGAVFRILSRAPGEDGAREHCRGEIATLPEEAAPPPAIDLEAARRATPEHLTAEVAAARSSRGFLVTGPRWEAIEEVRIGDGDGIDGGDGVDGGDGGGRAGTLLAKLSLPVDLAGDLEDHILHPSLLDIAVGCVQLARDGDFLPLAYERLRVWGALPGRLWSRVAIRPGGDEALTCDVVLVTADGDVVAEVEGFSMRRMGEAAVAGLESAAASEPAPPSAGERADETAEDAVLEGAITAEAASEILARVLGARRVPPQVVVSPRPLVALRKAYRAFEPTALLHRLGELASGGGPAQARPDGLGAEYVAPGEGMEKLVAEVWQACLGIEEIGIHDNFFELGGTSLIGVQVVAELERRLGREVSTVSLFEAPTVKALAALLAPSETAEAAFARTRSRIGRKKAALGRRGRGRGRGRRRS